MNKKKIAPCGICHENVSTDGVACDGYCKVWYHFTCLDIAEDEQGSITASREKWLCTECARLDDTLAFLLKEVENLKKQNSHLTDRLRVLDTITATSLEEPVPVSALSTRSSPLTTTAIMSDAEITKERREPLAETPSRSKTSNAVDTVTKFLRKIPKKTSLRDIYSTIKKVTDCDNSDFKIHQPVPDAQFKGKWKFVSITMNKKDEFVMPSPRVTAYPGFSMISHHLHLSIITRLVIQDRAAAGQTTRN